MAGKRHRPRRTHYNEAYEETELENVRTVDGESSPPDHTGENYSLGGDDDDDERLSNSSNYNYHTWSKQIMRELPSRAPAFEAHTAAVPQRTASSTSLRRRGQVGVPPASVRFATLGCPSDVEMIVARICSDEDLLGDDAAAEHMRLEALRQMPKSLTLKRKVRTRLNREASQRSVRQLSWWKRLKYSIAFKLSRVKMAMKDVFFSLEIWHGSLKTIEGHFGSGVGTYFRFLRWLFLLNLFTMLIMVGFVTVPQAIVWSSNENRDNSSLFSPSDLITAEGYVSNSLLFYGFYTNKTISLTEGLHYSIPQAYFFSTVTTLLLAMIALSSSVSREYRRNYTSSGRFGGVNSFCSKVFCGWDFSISDPDSAMLKHRSIHNELQELLEPWKEHWRKQPNGWQRAMAILVQLFVHALVVAVLVGSGLLMWYLLHGSLSAEENLQHPPVLLDLRLSAIVTALLVLLPMFFSWLVRWEDYRNHRAEVYMTMLRTYALEAVVIGVIVTFWLQEAAQCSSSWCQCWETALGRELYRLQLLDLLVTVLLTLVAETLRRYLYRVPGARFHFLGAPEFDVARSTLGLIYSQALVWVGLYTSPLMTVILAIKLPLTFYVKKISLLHNCRFSTRPWRAAQAHTVYKALALLSLLITLAGFGYVVTQVPSSMLCGPFRNLERPYGIVLQLLAEWDAHDKFLAVLAYLVKPGVMAVFIIAMCAAIYWMRSLAKARSDMVFILQEMLQTEAKDRQFLIHTIYKFLQATEITSPIDAANLKKLPFTGKNIFPKTI